MTDPIHAVDDGAVQLGDPEQDEATPESTDEVVVDDDEVSGEEVLGEEVLGELAGE